MIAHTLFDNGTRKWIFLGRDPELDRKIIDSNQYAIIHKGEALLLDPGGLEVFPEVSAGLARVLPLSSVKAIMASHQDPDIISSLSLWAGICPDIKVYLSWIWETFVAHYGSKEVLRPVPDEGMVIPLGDSNELKMIPAHYCHSSGNFSLYDPTAKILFSGDIGAALLPEGDLGLFVENFDAHLQYMEGFHRRWMPSNAAKNEWIARVRDLNVEQLCPQHGKIFKGADVKRFLDWLSQLEVGITRKAS
ncbi:MAG: FprA family A-type flavoprotein [Deltaproteobacteria bacterium]|nr:FprA family A-type flavoprotein [Deltaproteobacteria bacterium]